jgi:predicted RNA-binding Zn ribbon-like protein
LLTSDQVHRIAQCHDADGCGWLFLDHSRSRARQWCSMADCGNRAKARRHYRRSHKAGSRR